MSDILTDSSVVKRRNRPGRTPWRRIYSCIEPSTLLFAEAQDLQDLNDKFESVRQLDVFDDCSSSQVAFAKTKKRIHSARHFKIDNALPDISQLKNRQVSVKFSSFANMHHCKYVDSMETQTSEKDMFVAKKKTKDMKSARIRRHTVSRINFTSPFLPINETNEAFQTVLSSGAKSQEINQIKNILGDDNSIQDKNYENELYRSDGLIKAGYEAVSLPDLGEKTEFINLSDTLLSKKEERYLSICEKGSLELRENDMYQVSEDSENNQSSMYPIDEVDKDERVAAVDMNDNIIKTFAEFKLNDSGIQSRDSEDENSENNSSIDFDAESEPCSQTNARQTITKCKIEDSMHNTAARSLSFESDDMKNESSENETCEIQASVNNMLNEVLLNVERKLLECTDESLDLKCDEANVTFDEASDYVTKMSTYTNIQNNRMFSRRDSEPTVSYQEANNKLRKSSSNHKQTKRLGGIASDNGFRRLYQLAIAGIVSRTKKKPTILDFIALLEAKGIKTNDPRLKESQVIFGNGNTNADFTEEMFARIHASSFPLIRNVLLSKMTIPGFSSFKMKMFKVFENLSAALLDLETKGGNGRNDVVMDPTSNYLDFTMSRRKPGDTWLSMAVCTVDGQRLVFGESENLHPLDCCANVLNYCIACRQNGIDVMKSYMGRSPLTSDMDEFAVTDDGKLPSPFTKSGVLMSTAFLPQGESTDARMSILHDFYSRAMANEPLCCDNLSYNLKRLYAHEEISLAYFLSARHKLSKIHNAIPGDILELHFQSSSSATTSSACSVAAATLANGGICPLTGEMIFKEDIVKHTVKRLKTCHSMLPLKNQSNTHGMSFIWSESGCMLLIVPNVLGLVCFVQGLSRNAMTQLAAHLLQDVTSSFNFSVYRSLRK